MVLIMDTLLFIHISRDQPSAHEFTKVHWAAVTVSCIFVYYNLLHVNRI